MIRTQAKRGLSVHRTVPIIYYPGKDPYPNLIREYRYRYTPYQRCVRTLI